MKIEFKHLLRGLAATAAFGAIALPAAAQADTEQAIQGTIAAVTGTYSLALDDSHGYVDNVALHDGTTINPTGLTLAAGQTVTILGEPDGDVFVANEIDTPYAEYPAPEPYDAAPAVSVNLAFGNAWHADHRIADIGNRMSYGPPHADRPAPRAGRPVPPAPAHRAPAHQAPTRHR